MTDRIKEARPESITITQILMGISLVPITLGLIFSLLRGLVMDPRGIFSVRALLFFGISLSLMIIFLGVGFGGLWRRKKYGYWLGLIFLGAAIAANILSLAPKMNSILAVGSPGSDVVTIVDLVVQSVMLSLVTLLFLKVSFGRREKRFFNP
jgi:hypothetical protein